MPFKGGVSSEHLKQVRPEGVGRLRQIGQTWSRRIGIRLVHV